jgi:sugar phosphate isomerase/epimerase
MKLGFVSAILAELSLEAVLATAQELGYESVELMCWPRGKAERRYAGVTHIDVAGSYDPDEIRALCQQYKVEISALGYYPNPLCADREEGTVYVEHLKKVIDASAALGVNAINTFVGRDPSLSVAANWPRFLEIWPPLVEYAAAKGVRVGIENCPMLFSEDEWPGGKNLAVSPAIWRRMFEAIPDPHFGLNYDPSHLVWQQMDYIEPLWEFADRLHHVHAKDVRIDRLRLNDVGILGTPLEFHLPKIPGLGEINWGRFFSVLSDAGYRGHVAVEVEDRAFEGSLEGREAALAQSRRYLRNFV